jgi:hypothetical protein
MVEFSAPVFISTEEAFKLHETKQAKFIDCTTFMSADEGCPVLSYKSKHIEG